MTNDTRPLFDPKAPILDNLRRKWVQLDQGWICIREMKAADSLFVNEHSQRGSPGDPGFGIDLQRLQLWQIVCSCYAGEAPDAPRTFSIIDLERIKALRAAEWRAIQDAIDAVNGFAEAEVKAAENFTAAAPAPS